jgi:hypothetical protein
MQDPGYVKPYQAPAPPPGPGERGPRSLITKGQEADDYEEDLSKDADDEVESEWKMTPSEGTAEETAPAGGSPEKGEWGKKDPMDNEDFKMRYELGELSDDEILGLDEEDLAEYLSSGDVKDEL